jgi:hypothetical protein
MAISTQSTLRASARSGGCQVLGCHPPCLGCRHHRLASTCTPYPPCEQLLAAAVGGAASASVRAPAPLLVDSSPPSLPSICLPCCFHTLAPRIHPTSSRSQRWWGVLVVGGVVAVVVRLPHCHHPSPRLPSLYPRPLAVSSPPRCCPPLAVVLSPSPCRLRLLCTSLTPYEQLLVAEGSGAMAWSSRWWCWVPGCARRHPRPCRQRVLIGHLLLLFCSGEGGHGRVVSGTWRVYEGGGCLPGVPCVLCSPSSNCPLCHRHCSLSLSFVTQGVGCLFSVSFVSLSP